MTIGYGPRIVTDGLVLALDAADRNSYPGSGTTWTDLSGNGNNGTNSNITYSSTNGGIFYFNNSSSVSLISDSPSLNPTEGLTIEAWVNFDGNSDDFIYEKGDVNTQHSLFSHGGGLNDIRFRTYHADGGNNELFFDKTTEGFQSGRWHHLAATYDKSFKRLYLDATLRVSNSENRSLRVTSPGASIGRFGGTTTGYYFGGYIPKVSIYNRALSATEVSQNFQALRRRFGV